MASVRRVMVAMRRMYAISVAPFAVLLAYILRVATITRRTLAIGPFILRDSERDTQD